MAIRIPTYERQIEAPQQKAATTQMANPLRPAYGEDIHGAVGNVGKALEQLGDELIKINAKNTKDKIMLATNKFDIEYKKFKAELGTRSDYQNFSADTDKFLETQLGIMKQEFGEDLFSRWWNTEGQLLNDTVKAETDIMKLPASIKQQNKLLKDNINTQAYNYAASPKDLKTEILNSVKTQIETSNQPAEVKIALLRDMQSSFAKGDIEYNIYDNPEMVKQRILSGQYKEKYKDEKGQEKTRSFITPQEEARYLHRCDTIIKSREGTIKDSKIKPFYDEFEEKYAQSPALANQYLNSLRDRKKLKEAGLDTKQINTTLKAMETAMTEGEFGQESIAIEQENTIDKRMLIMEDKDLKKTGDFLPVEKYVEFVNDCNAVLNPENLTRRDYSKVIKNRDEILARMGDSIKQEDYSPTTDIDTTKGIFFRTTNNGYLRDQLREVFVKSGMLEDNDFKDITNQDVGAIYANAYQYCSGMNMSGVKDQKSEIKIQEAVSKAVRNWVSAKTNKTAEEAQEYLIGKKLIKLRKDTKEESQGIVLNSYKE